MHKGDNTANMYLLNKCMIDDISLWLTLYCRQLIFSLRYGVAQIREVLQCFWKIKQSDQYPLWHEALQCYPALQGTKDFSGFKWKHWLYSYINWAQPFRHHGVWNTMIAGYQKISKRKYSRVSFCDSSFYDDSLLRSSSSRTNLWCSTVTTQVFFLKLVHF